MILNYVQALVSWPGITLVLGLVAMYQFHDAVLSFLKRRDVKVEAYGWSLTAANPTEQRQEVKDFKENPEFKSNTDLEKYIRENPQEVIREYLRAFNGYRFQRAYNLIFGSQMNLLEYLSSKGAEGEKYVNLLPFYNKFVSLSNLQSAQFADYLGFLKDSLFIEYIGESSDLSVQITPLGVDFLTYIKSEYPTTYNSKPL